MPIKVLLLQTDNRPNLDYLTLTRKVNEKAITYLQNIEDKTIEYTYEFKLLEPKYYENIHPACGKIFFMNQLLQETEYNYILFLDSDAWLQNPVFFHKLLLRIKDNVSIHGVFSRDPYMTKNTYINSGSFVLKVNDFTRNLYREIIEHLGSFNYYHHRWPYDQYYISDKIFKKRKHFMILIPHILNTPHGEILRHNWFKNYRMYKDTYALLEPSHSYNYDADYDFDKYIDKECFPNPNVTCWNYDD